MTYLLWCILFIVKWWMKPWHYMVHKNLCIVLIMILYYCLQMRIMSDKSLLTVQKKNLCMVWDGTVLLFVRYRCSLMRIICNDRKHCSSVDIYFCYDITSRGVDQGNLRTVIRQCEINLINCTSVILRAYFS